MNVKIFHNSVHEKFQLVIFFASFLSGNAVGKVVIINLTVNIAQDVGDIGFVTLVKRMFVVEIA